MAELTNNRHKNINNESTNGGTSVEKKSIKKKNTSNETSTVTKVKKTKKTKKYEEKENISVKSGFGKFDQLIKKPILHVRSSDATKAQQQFSQNKALSEEPICKACNKAVFAMEQIKAERQVWHKNCFRCRTCSKQLTVDIYSSHEGELYCKPHFRNLFKPKVVVDDEEPASDRPDLGLEELSSLNVMSRFQVFEKPSTQEKNIEKSPVSVKRSQSILSKLARFQAKGMDVGVSSDIFNGIDYEESSSSEEEENGNVVKSNTAREKPIAFNKMDDVKKTFERGQMDRREERREERRQELQQIRSRLFMGKQGKMKEAYEQAVAESEKGTTKRDVEVKSEKARSIKEKFERGEVCVIDGDEEDHDTKPKSSGVKEDEFSVFEAGISKKSRSIFQQLDANVAKSKSTNQIQSQSPINLNNSHEGSRSKIVSQTSSEIVRSSDPVADVPVETAEISSKFKFFQTYKPPEITRKKFRITPPREGEQKDNAEEESDDNISTVNNGRCVNDVVDDEIELKKSQTTAKMLSFFRQMEESQDSIPDVGRKPLKKFTPPPGDSSSSEEESTDESEEPSETNSIADDIVRASYKVEDEFLKQAQNAARAKALKEKFEHWEPQKQSLNSSIINDVPEGEQTKSLRAKFESLRSERQTSFEKPRPKVNRFI